MQRSSHFHTLSASARQAIGAHNVFLTGGMNGYLVGREVDAFRNPTYMMACSALYGSDYMNKCARDNDRLEPNGNLIKVMLFVLLFSSNFSIVMPTGHENTTTTTTQSSIELMDVQHVYVTLLWKYLVYLYGYNQAAMRFSSMIKSAIDMLGRVEELTLNPSHQLSTFVQSETVEEID